MAEDIAAELDALQTSKGPGAITCQFWREASEELRESIRRNSAAKGHTIIFRHLKSKGLRVTAEGVRDHAAGVCKCQR